MFGSRDRNDVILRDADGNATAVATVTPLQGCKNGAAIATEAEELLSTELGEQRNDAPTKTNSERPESTPDYSMISLAVDGERLDASNPIDYLVMLLLEGKRYDGTWDGDETEVARWAVAQWCHELGWVPDLRNYEVGEQVERGDTIACLDTAFYSDTNAKEECDDGGVEAEGDDA